MKIPISIPECMYTSPIQNIDDFRHDELKISSFNTKYGEFYFLSIDREEAILSASLNIGRTTIICLILMLAAFLFSKDTNDLILHPIERMIDLVNKIARDPLSSREERVKKSKKNEEHYETLVIENSILKIGKLLALGFGEAGSEIIGSKKNIGIYFIFI